MIVNYTKYNYSTYMYNFKFHTPSLTKVLNSLKKKERGGKFKIYVRYDIMSINP